MKNRGLARAHSLKISQKIDPGWLAIRQADMRFVERKRRRRDRKSTRLNSSHVRISYAVFCLKKKKRGYFKPYFIAITYVALGDHDQAFDYLEKSFAERDNWLLWFATEPKLDPLRSDPRFDQLFRRTNNPLALR